MSDKTTLTSRVRSRPQTGCVIFSLLLSFAPSYATCQTVSVKTAPKDYALVWTDASGTVPPQMIMRVDSYKYPENTSVRKFLSQPTRSSPEAFLAHYLLTVLLEG